MRLIELAVVRLAESIPFEQLKLEERPLIAVAFRPGTAGRRRMSCPCPAEGVFLPCAAMANLMKSIGEASPYQIIVLSLSFLG